MSRLKVSLRLGHAVRQQRLHTHEQQTRGEGQTRAHIVKNFSMIHLQKTEPASVTARTLQTSYNRKTCFFNDNLHLPFKWDFKMNSIGFYKSCVALMQQFCLIYNCCCAVFALFVEPLSKDIFFQPCRDELFVNEQKKKSVIFI